MPGNNAISALRKSRRPTKTFRPITSKASTTHI